MDLCSLQTGLVIIFERNITYRAAKDPYRDIIVMVRNIQYHDQKKLNASDLTVHVAVWSLAYISNDDSY